MTVDLPIPQGRGIFDRELLDRCMSCGFCLPACPTYTLTGDEQSSPRGRITLMRALEDGTLAADDPTLVEQSSQCLGCRACEPVCPAGVQYGELLEQWRDHQWQGSARPALARLLMLAAATPGPLALAGLLRRQLDAATARLPVRPGRRASKGLRTRRRTAGTLTRPEAPVAVDAVPEPAPQPTAPTTTRGANVEQLPGPNRQLMLGCFEPVLYPQMARRVSQSLPGIEVPLGQGCCGALHAHNGELDKGRRMAQRLGRQLPEAILTTSGGCAAHLASVLGRDRVVEFSEVVAAEQPSLPRLLVDGRTARFTLQDSCHLRNGLDVHAEPRAVLRGLGEFVELPGAGGCCGAAGSYALLRPADSKRVLDPKLDAIEALDVDALVVVNPGCYRQVQQGLRRRRSRIRVVHLAELVAVAAGGTDRHRWPERGSRFTRTEPLAGAPPNRGAHDY